MQLLVMFKEEEVSTDMQPMTWVHPFSTTLPEVHWHVLVVKLSKNPRAESHVLQLLVVFRYESSIYMQPITWVHPFPIAFPETHWHDLVAELSINPKFESHVLQLLAIFVYESSTSMQPII